MRRSMKRLVLPLIAVACAGCGPAGDGSAVSGRIVRAALGQGRAYEKLAYLTDRIGPRLSGSEGLERAVRWTAEEFRRDGLDRVWTEPVMVPHWVRGEETSRIVSPVQHPMATTALGMSVPTPEGGVSGEVVEVSSFEELKALGARVQGRIVLYNKPVLTNGGEKDGYGSAVGLRGSGAIEAAKLGAVATLIRSLGTASFRLPHTGAMRYDENVTRIPSAAISTEDADLIHRLLAAGESVRVHLVLGCQTLPDAPSANVLADLPGRERPEEIVLIGAHLDSWDLGTGAIDDGAGVAIVMETMRLLTSLGLTPRRTIRAALFTNEENGLGGGRAYAEVHADELPRHVAAIETDSGGASPQGFGVSAGEGAVEIVRSIAAALDSIGAGEISPGGGGADIGPMKPAGVPLLGLRQETTHYFDYHHTAADTLDKVRPDELARNVAAMAVMAYGLAEREEPLPRLPAPASTP